VHLPRHLPVLSLSGVTKAYRAGVPGCHATVRALTDISLSVHAGECAIVSAGPRSGKTTLLLCAAGMLRPDRGRVSWPALVPRQDRPPAGIAYVTERIPAYNFLTVRESVAYALAVHAAGNDSAAPQPDHLLVLTSLLEHAETRLGLLGPAARMNLLIALALVATPRLLLVDDLAGGADDTVQRSLSVTLERVAGEGAAIVWAARDLAAGEARYELDAGRLSIARWGGAGVRRSPKHAPPRETDGVILPLRHPPLAPPHGTPSPLDAK
jgi:ABC-type multidrug transport system ATPase subunit